MSGSRLYAVRITVGGKPMTGLTVVRIVEGRIVESWVKNDVMGLMNQLGAGHLNKQMQLIQRQ
jgi:hypothetical protein